MADWHLTDLENALTHRGWQVVKRLPGDDYAISGAWQIQRSTQIQPLIIEFEGLDDLRTLPVEESYGCHIRGHFQVGLYFGKKGANRSSHRKRWLEELSRFVDALAALRMDVVYILHYIHEFDDGHKDDKIIGVFSSEAEAFAALELVINQSGFQESADGFEITKWILGEVDWCEGYITILPEE